MLNEIQLAIASITGAKSIAEGLVAERDTLKLAELATTLNARLIEAQASALNVQRAQALLNEELARLKKENAELADRLKRVERTGQEYADYKLTAIARGHCVVYAARPDETGMCKPPYLCATCLQEGKHSALNFEDGTLNIPGKRFVCPVSATHTLRLPRGGWTLQNVGQTLKDG